MEVVETEVARYRQKCETLEKQLETSNKDLADERQKAQVTVGLFFLQGSHRLDKYLNIQDCLENSLKIKFALKSS